MKFLQFVITGNGTTFMNILTFIEDLKIKQDSNDIENSVSYDWESVTL